MSRYLLSREEIVALLTELGARLAASGLHGELYIVGGAAMALQFDAREATRDVDAVFSPPDDVLRVAHEIAAERGLPSDWLNASAAAFIPARESEPPLVLDVPGLSASSASAEHLLAMKMAAGRYGRDLDDIATLLRLLRITSAGEALAVARRVYGPDSVVLSDTAESYVYLIEDALALDADGEP